MIQLNIDAEVEQRVVQAALARGIEPSAYISQIVAEAVAFTSPRHLNDEEFRRVLDRLAARGGGIPSLPDSAYSRESIYGDHD